MVFQKIKLDNCTEFGRTGTIDTKKGRFTTPNRSINNSELNKFHEVNKILKKPNDFFMNPILEIVLDLSSKKLSRLHSINGYYGRSKTGIKKKVSTFNQGPVLLFPRLEKATRDLTLSDLKVLVDLQGDSGVIDLAGIPDPRQGRYSSEFEQLMTKTIKRLDSKYPELYPVPFIRLDQDKLVVVKKIKWLLAQDLSIIAFIRVGDPQTGLYAVEETLRDKNIWIHLSNVRKQYTNRIPIAQRNIVPLDGFDTVSAWKGHFAGGETGPSDRMAEDVAYRASPNQIAKKTIKSTSLVKFFSSYALGFLNSDEYEFRFGSKLHCSCPICNRGTIDSRDRLLDEFKNHSLPLEVHEAVASSKEIVEQLTPAIAKSNQRDYLLSKSLVKEFRGSISKYFPNKKISEYF